MKAVKTWKEFEALVAQIKEKLVGQNNGESIDDLPMIGASTCEGNLNCCLPYEETEIINDSKGKRIFLPL